jgi:dihydroorotase
VVVYYRCNIYCLCRIFEFIKENHLVLRDGRIVDPANNFDEIADIVIRRGKIHCISETRTERLGAKTVDLKGKWLMPGQAVLTRMFFLSVSSHTGDIYGNRFPLK